MKARTWRWNRFIWRNLRISSTATRVNQLQLTSFRFFIDKFTQQREKREKRAKLRTLCDSLSFCPNLGSPNFRVGCCVGFIWRNLRISSMETHVNRLQLTSFRFFTEKFTQQREKREKRKKLRTLYDFLFFCPNLVSPNFRVGSCLGFANLFKIFVFIY